MSSKAVEMSNLETWGMNDAEDMMQKLSKGEGPKLNDQRVSPLFQTFCQRCLTASVKDRPSAAQLLLDPLFVDLSHVREKVSYGSTI